MCIDPKDWDRLVKEFHDHCRKVNEIDDRVIRIEAETSLAHKMREQFHDDFIAQMSAVNSRMNGMLWGFIGSIISLVAMIASIIVGSVFLIDSQSKMSNAQARIEHQVQEQNHAVAKNSKGLADAIERLDALAERLNGN